MMQTLFLSQGCRQAKEIALSNVSSKAGRFNEENDKYRPHILGVRFPRWLVCPSCDRLGEAKEFQKEVGDPSRWCERCSKDAGRRIHVVPIRFISACENGHLSDFPWQFYFSRTAKKTNNAKPDCGEQKHRLYLRSDGNSSGLESLFCTAANARAFHQ